MPAYADAACAASAPSATVPSKPAQAVKTEEVPENVLVKEEFVPAMPAGAHVKVEDELVPPMPEDACIKEEAVPANAN